MVSFQAQTTVSTTLPACVYLIGSDTDPVIQRIHAHHPDLDPLTADARFSTDFLSVFTVRVGRHYLVLVGLDNRTDAVSIGHAVATGCQTVQALELEALSLYLSEAQLASSAAIGQWIGQSVAMGTYAFDRYKSNPKTPNPIQTIDVITDTDHAHKAILADLAIGMAIGTGVNQARDLANMPANDLNPTTFIEKIESKFSSNAAISVRIIDETEAADMGMNCLVAVGQGSRQPSALAIITYTGDKQSSEHTAIVGKGITFDTGGISLKPANNMKAMKGDMSGAAAVFGAMHIVDTLKPKINVTAYIALAENMPSGHAQRPGDVITAYNGTSVEIVNTDAEGRLVLADALAYAVEKKPARILDIATLTGAAMVALGREALGIMGNNQAVIDRTKACEATSGERVWQLPLYDSFKPYLKSTIADIAHCSEERYGGTCTAAKFLEQFVDDAPWVHVDMAPKMDNTKTKGVDIDGMSGAGTRLIYRFLTQ
tara:strand:- start:431 stop:1888 length:1458 start_codon:yes stop_codon:yes gene_type:complete